MANPKPNPLIVFHDLAHARAALAAAAERGVPVTLRTAPGAAAYAGPLYLKEIADRALGEMPGVEAQALIDCASDPALALAALRMGWRRVLYRGRGKVPAKLADIAGQLGAEIMRGAPAGLDLLDSADAPAACRAYLEPTPGRR